MKKLLSMAILSIMLFVLTFAFVGCGKNKITNITFCSVSTTYNGQKQEIKVQGDTKDCIVLYENNYGTDVGVYNARVTIKKIGYEVLNLCANLTITKANPVVVFEGINTKYYLGDTIDPIPLEGGEIVFDESVVKSVGARSYTWRYIPSNTNYMSVKRQSNIVCYEPTILDIDVVNKIAYFEQNIYGKMGEDLSYNIDNLNDDIGLNIADFYIPVINNISNELNEIHINNILYLHMQNLVLSLGCNSTISQPIFKVFDNTLNIGIGVFGIIPYDNFAIKIFDYKCSF